MKSLSKESTIAMKGFAIIFIMLHNFLHIRFSQENEMTFSFENTQLFFQNIMNDPLNVIWNIFSFIGWVGVPVFVLLSGYGLEKKYQNIEAIDTRSYIKHSYLKLFWLLLPAALFYFAGYYFLEGSLTKGLNSVFVLTMLNNFVCNIIPFSPGVYWYFGLTFQLYMLYLILRRFSNKYLLMGGGAFAL